MRKIFGLLIALVAVVFLGMAYSQLAHADPAECDIMPSDQPECDSVLANKIVELVKMDQSKILDVQYDLTALKLAQETLKANEGGNPNSATVEAYIRRQEDLIKKLEKNDENRGIRAKLAVLYQKYGELSDVEKIEAGLTKIETEDERKAAIAYRQRKADDSLQESVDKARSASYFKISKTDKSRDLRFRNRDLSAYVLAHTLVKGDKTFDQNDASILWFKAQISEGVEAATSRGSLPANLQETSTRVAQLTGVAGTVGKSPDEIKAKIAAKQEEMNIELDAIILTYKDELKKSCAEMTQCETCGENDGKNRVTDEHRQMALNKAITAITLNLKGCDQVRDEKVKKVMAELAMTKAIPMLDPPVNSGSTGSTGNTASTGATPSTGTTSVTGFSTSNMFFSQNFGFSAFSQKWNADPLGIWKTKPTPNIGTPRQTFKLVGGLKPETSYNLANTSTKYKKCAGNFDFSGTLGSVAMNFSITDPKTSEVICKGTLPVERMDYDVWNDADVADVCLKQNKNFVTTCTQTP